MRRTFTPDSSLDSEVDLNASYLENTILVTSDLQWLGISGWGLGSSSRSNCDSLSSNLDSIAKIYSFLRKFEHFSCIILRDLNHVSVNICNREVINDSSRNSF